MKANEPLEALAADLRRMLAFAIPDTPLKDLELFLKFQFLKALPESLARQLESHAHSTSFDQLVCRARLKTLSVDNRPEAVVRKIAPAVECGVLDELQSQMRDLQLSVQRIGSDQRWQKREQPRIIKCFKCQRPGHYADQCPLRGHAGNGTGSWRKN
jgi:hypothetical protein